eukprot:scaffold8253_cov45-Phaeocystis_antarctica.AAC.1
MRCCSQAHPNPPLTLTSLRHTLAAPSLPAVAAGGAGGTAAWSKRPLGSAPARLLRLLRARLTALGSSTLPGRDRPIGRPATASGARASRLRSRRFHRL